MKPVAIIGIGNYLMSDEGVGIHAIEHLQSLEWPDDVALIDAGTPGVSLIYMMERRKFTILIDCADFGGKPGEIGVFTPPQLERDENKQISLHATDVPDVLDLAEKIGIELGEVKIVGIQPKRIEMGTSLSSELMGSLEKLPELLEREIK